MNESEKNPTKAWSSAVVEQLLKDVAPEKEPLYRAVLSNTLEYSDQSAKPSPLGTGLLAVAKGALDSCLGLDLVGVQPMPAPICSTMFLTAKIAEDTGLPTSLSVEKEVVTATTKNLATILEFSEIADATALDSAYQRAAQSIAGELDVRVISELAYLAHPMEFNYTDGALPIFINMVCNEIARKTFRGAGNWVVARGEVAEELRKSNIFELDPDYHQTRLHRTYPHLVKLGKLNQRITVYEARNWDADFDALVGYKGSSEIDTGFYLCPYHLLTMDGENELHFAFRSGQAAAPRASSYYVKLQR